LEVFVSATNRRRTAKVWPSCTSPPQPGTNSVSVWWPSGQESSSQGFIPTTHQHTPSSIRPQN